MFVLVLITCMTFGECIACQEFECPHNFTTEQSCQRAASIEEGRYAGRGTRRPWIPYSWNFQGGATMPPPVRHNRGRSAG
jgi:hypothetical protein